jgi:hypothetical protein
MKKPPFCPALHSFAATAADRCCCCCLFLSLSLLLSHYLEVPHVLLQCCITPEAQAGQLLNLSTAADTDTLSTKLEMLCTCGAGAPKFAQDDAEALQIAAPVHMERQVCCAVSDELTHVRAARSLASFVASARTSAEARWAPSNCRRTCNATEKRDQPAQPVPVPAVHDRVGHTRLLACVTGLSSCVQRHMPRTMCGCRTAPGDQHPDLLPMYPRLRQQVHLH